MRHPVVLRRPFGTARLPMMMVRGRKGRQSQQLFPRGEQTTLKRGEERGRRDLNEFLPRVSGGMQFHALEWNEEARTTRKAPMSCMR